MFECYTVSTANALKSYEIQERSEALFSFVRLARTLLFDKYVLVNLRFHWTRKENE